jgi:hypothetical protein
MWLANIDDNRIGGGDIRRLDLFNPSAGVA